MVGILLVGFVWLNILFSVSWQVDFQWGSCGQSLVFCVIVGRLLVGFLWLNLKFSVSWQVDFQWGSCGSIFSFLCQGCQLLVGFVWINLQFSVSWLVDFQWGSCGSIFSFLRHGSHTFNGVRVFQSLVFCVMVGRLLVGFVWLKLQFSVSWQVDFQWGSCGSFFSFLCHGWQTFSGLRESQSLDFGVMVGRLLVGFVWFNLQFSMSWQVDFQWGSCDSIFRFLCHGWQTFSGVRVAQSLDFCVMVGRILVGFVWLNLQFSVSWLVDFQWGSCGSIFIFLCHGRQTFSGVRLAQSLVFCVMVGRLLVGFVWLNRQFSVSWQVDFQSVWCDSIQFYVSWLVDFQWGSCGSILGFCVMVGRFQWGSCGSIVSFLGHGWQTFSSGVRVAQSLVLCHGRQTFSGVRVAQSLVFCVMVGRLLVGFVWLNLQFSVSWLVDFQWGSCGSIFSFVFYGRQTFVGFVWLNLQFSVSWLVDFQCDSCGSIFSFLRHGRQTFSGVPVTQSLVFCVMVGRLLVGFVWLNLQFSVSWQVDFQWGSCDSIFRFLCHGWQTFSGVRVAQSLDFCVMVGRILVGFV